MAVRRQEQYVHFGCLWYAPSALEDCDGGVGRDHPCEDGSLYSQEDVVARDYLSIYGAFSEGLNRLSSVLLEAVHECDYSQDTDALQELYPVQSHHFLNLPLCNFLEAKSNAPIPLKRKGFDEFIVLYKLQPRALMNHFWTAFRKDKILV